MLYASYIVAMLSHQTFPGGTNVRFRGLHASMSSVLRRRSRLLQTGLTSDLAAYARTCKANKGAGDFVANNLIEFLQKCPNLTGRELLFSDAAPVFLGNNSRTFVSRLAGGTATKNVAKISTQARHLLPSHFDVAAGRDGTWTRVTLPAHRYCSLRTVQLNTCKLVQVLKALDTGVLRKPRLVRAEPVQFNFAQLTCSPPKP